MVRGAPEGWEVKRFSEVIEINPRIELIKMKKAFCRNGGVVN